ncbi:hypothetical protein CCH79_00001561 [Gambusia affinis]|uniref:Thrombospondin-like N-terminal domain-containing protein n=1 Tax=Gambusia affinis TaxID=33528 RepID=A0A315VPY8_GAMAF|nr:hypothetical protein CCH79_00001561 [Gambusia affinis]
MPVLRDMLMFVAIVSISASAHCQKLPSFDLLEGFHVPESKGVKRVDGSEAEAVAYRINPSIHLQKTLSDVYPDGLPTEYSIITTFKVNNDTAQTSWNLWQVSDPKGQEQVGLRFQPDGQSLDFFYTGPQETQMVRTFQGLQKLFNREWHKLALSVKGNQVRLLIDCKEIRVESIDEPRPVIRQGYTSIVKRAARDRSASVDLQQMQVSCDPEQAYSESCCELSSVCGGYAEIGLTAGRATCKCMHGQPGLQGSPGPKGHRGLPGKPGDQGRLGNWGIHGNTGDYGNIGETGPKGEQGIKGEKGMRGPWGQRGERGPQGLKGLKGAAGFKGIRGLPGDIGEDGKPGEMGSKGLRGYPGIPGFEGVKGQKGNSGATGRPGPRGKQGIVGDPGERGAPGEKGKPGIQGLVGRAGTVGSKVMIKLTQTLHYITQWFSHFASQGIIGDPGLPGRDGDPGIECPTIILRIKDPRVSVEKLGVAVEREKRAPWGQQEKWVPKAKLEATKNKADSPLVYKCLIPKGLRGYKGSAGKPGRPGFIGPPGPILIFLNQLKHVNSLQGHVGVPGKPGIKGDTGIQGIKGVKGAEGEKGVKGLNGRIEVSQVLREAGGSVALQAFLVVQVLLEEKGFEVKEDLMAFRDYQGPTLPAEHVIEVCKKVVLEQMSTFANSVKRTCAAVCPLYGDVPMGATGPPGQKGPPGPPGDPGTDGVAGEMGLPGFYGEGGEPGRQGESGDRGEHGDKGVKGYGIPGFTGDQGPKGQRGRPGRAFNGQSGKPGERGHAGRPGLRGHPGLRGPPGICVTSGCAEQNSLSGTRQPAPQTLRNRS